MKIILAVFFCGFLVAAKAEEPVETEYEDPAEAELNDLAELDLDDMDDKPTNMEVAFEGLTMCLSGEKGQLKPHSPCLRKFASMLPKEILKEKRREIVECIVKGLRNCRKRPQNHEFLGCMTEAAKCVMDEDGSGSDWF